MFSNWNIKFIWKSWGYNSQGCLLKRHSENGKLPFITEEAKKILIDYNWPGNVRELENVLQRAIVLSDDKIIDKNHIMVDVGCNANFYKNFDENIKQAII